MFMKVLVINGPNLSRLDIRDSSIYGDMSYPQLEAHIRSAADSNGFVADVRQSDDEATIIGWLHEAADANTPVIINPAAKSRSDSVANHELSIRTVRGE